MKLYNVSMVNHGSPQGARLEYPAEVKDTLIVFLVYNMHSTTRITHEYRSTHAHTLYARIHAQCIHTHTLHAHTHAQCMHTHTLYARIHAQCIHTHTLYARIHAQCIHTHTLYARIHAQCIHAHTLYVHTRAHTHACTCMWCVCRCTSSGTSPKGDTAGLIQRDVARDLVVLKVHLRHFLVGRNGHPDDIVTRCHICDVNPLTGGIP